MQIHIDGQPLDLMTQPLVIDGRTMVPVRVVSEEMGAEVSWNARTEIIRIELKDRVIHLKLGSRQAYIQNRPLQMEVGPRLVDGRTYVPLRFVAEALGADVVWDEDQNMIGINRRRPQIEVVTVDGNRLYLRASDDVSYQTGLSEVADHFYIQIENVDSGSMQNTRYFKEGLISRLVPTYREGEGTFHLGIDLALPVSYRVDEQGKELVVEFSRRHERLTALELNDDFSGFSFVLSDQVDVRLFELTDPGRLVIDIPGGMVDLPNGQSELTPSRSGILQRVRAGQFDHDVARLVAEIESPIRYVLDNRRREDGYYEYTVRFMNRLDDIMISDYGDRSIVEIKTSAIPDYEIRRLEDPNRLVIEFQNTVVKPDKHLDRSINNGVIDRIGIEEFEASPKGVRVMLELPYYREHRDLSHRFEGGVALMLRHSPLYGRTIVLDPGHGGRDPGAIGPTGLMEKEVALRISKILRDRLQEYGATVVMTRFEDVYVSLEERSEIANRAKADILVSIHSNSLAYGVKSGIETFAYYGSRDATRLAELVQSSLVEKTGLTSHGVKFRNLFILRRTRMPAILPEVGFISHPQDEKLLRDKDFLKDAAEGIFSGIKAYFEELST